MSTIKKIGIPKDERGNDPNDYRDDPDYLNELKPVSVLSQFTLNGKAADFLNMSQVTLWRLGERDPTFPKKIKVSERMCFYRRSELEQWLAGKEVA